MCKLNPQCTKENCNCHEYLPEYLHQWGSFRLPAIAGCITHDTPCEHDCNVDNQDFSIQVMDHLRTQTSSYEKWAKSMETMNVNLQELAEHLKNQPPNDIIPSPVLSSNLGQTSKAEFFKILTNGRKDFEYRLTLESEILMPVYKERAFQLNANLVDMQGEIAPISKHCRFKIMLYTTEIPSKQVKVTTSGETIMRGTVEYGLNRGQNHISFERIVIKEVTSHFRHGCFFLVVMPSSSNIEPLIIENVVIKARKRNKPKEPELCKKMKIES